MGRTKKKPIRNFQENKHKKREEAHSHAQLLSSVSSRLLPEQQQQVEDNTEKKEPIEIDIDNGDEKNNSDFILAQHSNTTSSTISPNKRKRIIESSDEEDEDDVQKEEDKLILSGEQIKLKATTKRICIDIKAVVESECNEASKIQKKDTSCLRIITSFCLKPNHTLHIINSTPCPSSVSDKNRENLKENDTIIETDIISAKSLLLVYFLTKGGEDTDVDDFNMIVRSKLYLKEIEPLIIAIEQQMINVYFSTTHIRENNDDDNKKSSSTTSSLLSMNVFISLTHKVFELCTPQTTNVLPLPKFEYSHHLSELLEEEEKEKEGNTSKNSCNSRKQKRKKKNSPKRRKRNYNTGVGRAIVLRESLSLLLSSSRMCPSPPSLIIDIAKNPKPSPEKITSKMIYSVIDNMHDVSEEKNQPLLDKPKNLVPTLRPYQQAALNWMLKREQKEIKRMERQDNHNDTGDNGQEQEQQAHKNNTKVEESESCWEACWLVLIMCEKKKGSIDVVENLVTVMPLYEWKTLKEQDEETAILFYNPFIGWICESYEKAKSYTLSPCSASSTKRVKGGILCDQMGLGKTVEVLACMLSNPAPSNRNNNANDIIPSSVLPQQQSDNANVPPKEKNSDAEIFHDDVACICGKDYKFPNCLGWVYCESCRCRLHGICANYTTKEDIPTTTSTVVSNGNSYNICPVSKCPFCVSHECLSSSSKEEKTKKIKSRATLIITPPAILEQWQREIRNHTSSQAQEEENPLKVITYTGISEICKSSITKHNDESTLNSTSLSSSSSSPEKYYYTSDRSLLNPINLANADIVLTTFQALSSDLSHCDNPYVVNNDDDDTGSRIRSRRHGKRKRFRVMPSPLICIDWWRLILDEAQKIDKPTANAAKVCLRLTSEIKWCVTGTPISHGVTEDLYGLLLFLNVSPYDNKKSFQHVACSDLNRLKHILKDITWRSTKKNPLVRSQMGVPEQIQIEVKLQLSSIEKHFYDRQLEKTLVATSDFTSSSTSKKKGNNAALQVQRLRAACCHPQVGSQGLMRLNSSKRGKKKNNKDNMSSAATGGENEGILTMNQILDRLIDDAKTKCEEIQRVVIMHSNALASLFRLKMEAKTRQDYARYIASDDDDDEKKLLKKSIDLYMKSLEMTKANAKPSKVIGEAILSGCSAFQCTSEDNQNILVDGRGFLEWHMKDSGINTTTTTTIGDETDGNTTQQQLWCRFDFDGPAKKLVSIRARSMLASSDEDHTIIIQPKKCVFQVSLPGVGFVDVCTLEFPSSAAGAAMSTDSNVIDGTQQRQPNNAISSSTTTSSFTDWISIPKFRTKSSKNWRFLILSYHPINPQMQQATNSTTATASSSSSATKNNTSQQKPPKLGIEIQLFEPEIASDDLQEMHISHNASLTYNAILQLSSNSTESPQKEIQAMKDKLLNMQKESERLEKLYLNAAHSIHTTAKFRLQEQSTTTTTPNISGDDDYFDNKWWSDFISFTLIQDRQEFNPRVIFAQIQQDLFDNTDSLKRLGVKSIPSSVHDLNGLHAVILMKIQKHDISKHDFCRTLNKVRALSKSPADRDILDNSTCKRCRKDWYQTGPVCQHCILEEDLLKLEEELNDPLLNLLFRSLSRYLLRNTTASSSYDPQLKDGTNSSSNNSVLGLIQEKAKKFFKCQEAKRKQVFAAKLVWRSHFDLLSDLGELNQCKESMRFLQPGEDLSDISAHELNFIVSPDELSLRIQDHEAKEAMAASQLKSAKHTLQYLRNQSINEHTTCHIITDESSSSSNRSSNNNTSSTSPSKNKGHECVVCLSAVYETERAVLQCGHYFHYSPCFEKLLDLTKQKNKEYITCPMRCAQKTKKDNVMIASNEKQKRQSSNSIMKNSVKGSWGTKVERLVSDLLDMKSRQEKGIVFSQWEDLLTIIENALSFNNILYTRPKGRKNVGKCTNIFRGADISVLLLNVKSGAEGLTLVNATHVFMVDPLMIPGLDIQAINRVHRIGQTKKTYVHRYIVQDTVEEKIESRRREKQCSTGEEEEGDDEEDIVKKAGEFDGFTLSEIQELLT